MNVYGLVWSDDWQSGYFVKHVFLSTEAMDIWVKENNHFLVSDDGYTHVYVSKEAYEQDEYDAFIGNIKKFNLIY